MIDDKIKMQGDLNAVIVVTEAAKSVRVHTWAAQSGEVITRATTIDSFYQPVKYLLPIRESDTFAILYERTIHMVLLS